MTFFFSQHAFVTSNCTWLVHEECNRKCSNILAYQNYIGNCKTKRWNLGRNLFSLGVIAQSCIALQIIALNCTTIQFALNCTNTFCTSGQWPLGVIAHQSWPKRLNSGAMMQLPYALWKLNRIVKLLNTYSAFCKDNWNGHLQSACFSFTLTNHPYL